MSFRESLGHLLASEPDFEVVGQCSTSAEALELLEGTAVDLVLLELNIGTERSDEFISAARQVGYPENFCWSPLESIPRGQPPH